MSSPIRSRGLLGCVLIGLGLLTNPWFLGAWMAPDGTITSYLYLSIILLSNLFLVVLGLLFVRRSVDRWNRWLRGPRVVLTSAAILLVAAVILELGAYGLLWITSPDRAQRFTRTQHAVLSQPHRPEMTVPFHPLYGWKPRPDSTETASADEDIQYRRDRYGFVVTEPGETTALVPGADLRIFVIGGSTVRGFGHAADRTVPARLEDVLAERLTRSVNVVNAGVPGWFSVNQTAYLAQEIIPFFNPDMVVVLDGLNDTWRAVRAGQKFSRHPGGWWETDSDYLYDPRLEEYQRQFRLLQEDPGFVLNQLLHALGVRPYLNPANYYTGALLGGRGRQGNGASLAQKLRAMKDSECRGLPVNAHPYLSNVQTTVGITRGHDVRLVYALQPSIVFKEHLTSREQKILNRARVRMFHEGIPFRGDIRFDFPEGGCWERVLRVFFERAREGYRAMARGDPSHAVLRDLSRLFEDDRERRFADAEHYTAEANRLIARRLAREVQSLVLSDTKGPPNAAD